MGGPHKKRKKKNYGNVLNFMATNGLLVNPSKTSLVILNSKRKKEDSPIQIKEGNEKVTQSSSAKLLGINFNEKQKWDTKIQGPGGVTAALNKRLVVERRLRNLIAQKALLTIVDGLFTSKVWESQKK